MPQREINPAGYAVGCVLADRYRIQLVLAQRAASVVCLAQDLRQGDINVLIHSIPDPELAHRAPLLQQLFEDAQIVNVLLRDDLVPVTGFDVEPVSGTLFLVMEHRGQTAGQLVALAGPEGKTAAAFAEVARGLLEAHDAQFFKMDKNQETNPGIRLSSLPERRDGPRTGARVPRSSMGVATTAPPTHPPRPRTGTVPMVPAYTQQPASDAAAAPVYGAMPGEWREAEDRAPTVRRVRAVAQPAARRAAPKNRLTRTHLVVVTLLTVAVGTFLFVGAQADRPYYGPSEVQRRGWNDYSPNQRSFRPGPMESVQSPGHITITSEPPGAQVQFGLKPAGLTPVRIERPRDRSRVLLRISKPGYAEQTLVISPSAPALMSVILLKVGSDESAQPTQPNSYRDGVDKAGRLPSFELGANPAGTEKKKPSPLDAYDTSVRGKRERRRTY